MLRYSYILRFSCAALMLAMASMGNSRGAHAQANPPTAVLPGKLDEIQRRLAARDVGAETQTAQAAVLESLERWIAEQQRQEAAEKEAGGGSSGSGRKKGTPQSQPESESPGADAGESPQAATTQAGEKSGQGGWGRLSAPQREAWRRSLGQRGFPARYRQQLDAYFRRVPPSTAAPSP